MVLLRIYLASLIILIGNTITSVFNIFILPFLIFKGREPILLLNKSIVSKIIKWAGKGINEE